MQEQDLPGAGGQGLEGGEGMELGLEGAGVKPGLLDAFKLDPGPDPGLGLGDAARRSGGTKGGKPESTAARTKRLEAALEEG